MEPVYPPIPQFLRWQARYKTLPFVYRFPLEETLFFNAFKQGYSQNKFTFFLDSARAVPKGRYSYFSLEHPEIYFTSKHLAGFKKSWESLKNYIKSNSGPVLPSRYPAFYGGAAGALAYDAGRCFESGWRTKAPRDSLKLPLMIFGIYNALACYDHQKKNAFILCSFKNNREISGETLYKICQQKAVRFSKEVLKNSKRSFNPAPNFSSKPAREPLPNAKKTRFLNSVLAIQKYIAAGDIYQANLSQRFERPFAGSALAFYENLKKINPSPYSCFFQFPGFKIASASPELLIRKRGPTVETRPIAGTRPRGETKNLDKKLEGELLLNEKERAEHIMLLDLARNDLGKVCGTGSVKVKEKMAVEKYSHVMHIVSHVAGTLEDSKDFFGAAEAVFPGGTITGCPKIRCMEILDETEPARRSFFYGSGGWAGYQGDGDLNLFIRTALIVKSKIYIQAGSGIVADSVAEREFEESLHKAKALLLSLTF